MKYTFIVAVLSWGLTSHTATPEPMFNQHFECLASINMEAWRGGAGRQNVFMSMEHLDGNHSMIYPIRGRVDGKSAIYLVSDHDIKALTLPVRSGPPRGKYDRYSFNLKDYGPVQFDLSHSGEPSKDYFDADFSAYDLSKAERKARPTLEASTALGPKTRELFNNEVARRISFVPAGLEDMLKDFQKQNGEKADPTLIIQIIAGELDSCAKVKDAVVHDAALKQLQVIAQKYPSVKLPAAGSTAGTK
jgi:hypothetical protein